MPDYGIARTLTRGQTKMLQYLEIDCDGRREELQRLRSSPELRGRYEHFAVAVFRASGKRQGYGITPKAAQELHAILKDPDAAIQRGVSIGKTVHRLMQEKDLISDQMLARIIPKVLARARYARAIYPYKVDKATSGYWPIFKVRDARGK